MDTKNHAKDCNNCKHNTLVVSEEGMKRKFDRCKKCGGEPREFVRNLVIPKLDKSRIIR